MRYDLRCSLPLKNRLRILPIHRHAEPHVQNEHTLGLRQLERLSGHLANDPWGPLRHKQLVLRIVESTHTYQCSSDFAHLEHAFLRAASFGLS